MAATKKDEDSQKVSKYLSEICYKLLKDSGYPYPPDTAVDPTKAFVYGLATGTLLDLKSKWENR